MSRKFLFISSLLAGIASFATPLKVTSTTNLIGDLVSIIGETDVSSEVLMGEGVDPHLYKATAQDLVKLRSADVIFYNGLHLEGKLGETLERLSKKKKVVAVTDVLNPQLLLRDGASVDPHVWLDPTLWSQVAAGIAKELSNLAPKKTETFKKRLFAFQDTLADTAQWGQSLMKKIQKERRVLITSHDAFQYFGKFFGLEVHAIQGLSTESEAGLRDVQLILELIKARKIPAIFVESSVPRATIERVKESSQAIIGGELFSDSLGPRHSEAGTYIGMLRHNLDTIARGLSK